MGRTALRQIGVFTVSGWVYPQTEHKVLLNTGPRERGHGMCLMYFSGPERTKFHQNWWTFGVLGDEPTESSLGGFGGLGGLWWSSPTEIDPLTETPVSLREDRYGRQAVEDRINGP